MILYRLHLERVYCGWFGDKGSSCVVQAGLNLEILLIHCLEQGQKMNQTENYLTMDSVESKL